MSEKRQRNQQRRQRRKAKGAARSRPGAVSPERALAEVAQLAASSFVEVQSGLDAEQWASNLSGTWQREAPSGEALQTVLLPSFVRALEALGTADALAS